MTLWISLVLALLALAGSLYLLRRRQAHERIEAPYLIPEAGQHTIVLAHGLLGFDHLRMPGGRQYYFRGIAEHLRAQGTMVHVSRVAPLGTVPERAAALAAVVDELNERRVVIIAHSMGGLDARYALSKLGLSETVAALICIGTPHRGSCLANPASTLPVRKLRSLLGRLGLKTDALDWLGEGPSAHFNEQVQDAAGVHYGCVVGETTRSHVLANPLLLACFELLTQLRGSNDGLVPSFSQRWGRELQVVPAHHFGQIGWSWRFDARMLYSQILGDLHAGGLVCLPGNAPKSLPIIEVVSRSTPGEAPH